MIRFAGWVLLAGAAVGTAASSAPPAPPDVAAAPANASTAASGISTMVLQPGQGGAPPGSNDCPVVRFTAWTRSGTFFSTSGLRGETATQCLASAMPGIGEALLLMTPGEKRRLWIPAGLTFRPDKDDVATPAAGVALTVDLELVSIRRGPVTPPDVAGPPPAAIRRPSGLAYLKLQPGTGSAHPRPNSRVKVHYSGWTTDGSLFESTIVSDHPAVVLLGTAIEGWRELLPLMTPGERVRAWIPVALAYGVRPAEKSPKGSLVYEIQLLSFE